MINKSQIAVYGLGPASIFFLEKFIDTGTTINVYEYGKENNQSQIKTIDEINGPIKFFYGSNPERSAGFFGTAGLWRQKGVGGKFFKFDKSDIILNNWPISYKELDKHYQSIASKLDHTFKLNLDNELNKKINIIDETNFKIKKDSQSLTFDFAKIINFYKERLKRSKNINIYYEHPLINFEIDKNNSKILYANILKNKQKIKNFSNFHILSSGCLETNKIILETLRNYQIYIEKKKIGKKITFHPSCALGSFINNEMITKNFLKTKFDYKKEIICLKNKETSHNYNSGAFLSFNERNSKNIFSKIYNKFFGKISEINVSLAFEHFPSDLNFIRLSKKKDINGIRKININSNFCIQNEKFAENQYQIFISKLSKLKIFNTIFFKKKFLINLETNNHHHGGLAFGDKHSDPVDKNLNFRDLKNLYINSSAIFPSSSIYGPTFTIIAFASRLSDHILKKIKSI